MKTVKEVQELTGISIRTLRYYDEIGLLKPAEVTEAGYCLYDENSLKKLRQIMLFRELEVPLSEIREIVNKPENDIRRFLETQKAILERKRNYLNGMIEWVSDMLKGEDKVSFESFQDEDIQKIIRHSLEVMSEEDRMAVIDHYGDIAGFWEAVTEGFRDEKACEHLIKIYGSKEKAVEASLKSTGNRAEFEKQRDEMNRVYEKFAAAMKNSDEEMAMEAVKELGESCKGFVRVENARALLLEMAKDYLGHSQLEEGTDKVYGKGVTKYIGLAICRYYGVDFRKKEI